MSTLSREAEDRLISVAKQAVDLVDNHGHTPDAALTKLARQAQLGPHMIRLAAYAYNTGRQTAQRESSDNALDKFASFPLADAEKVVGTVFPKTLTKAASDQVSNDYHRPPSAFLARRDAPRRVKTAAATQPAPVAPTAQDVYFQHRCLKTAAESARFQAGAAYDRLLSAMGTLGDYFKKFASDRIGFADAAWVVETVHGDAGRGLMDFVQDRNHQDRREVGIKRASAPLKYEPGMAPWLLVENAMQAAAVVNTKRAAESAARQALEKHATEELAPHVAVGTRVKKASPLIDAPDEIVYTRKDVAAFLPSLPVAPPAAIKTAGPLGWITDMAMLGNSNVLKNTAENVGIPSAGGMGTTFGDTTGRTQSALLGLDDPAHNAQLQQIRSQSMLTGLMSDPALAKTDPDTILRNYNEIAQLAPRTAMQPLAMRQLLRRSIQAPLEQHEVGQAANIESQFKQLQAPPEQSVRQMMNPLTGDRPDESQLNALKLQQQNALANAQRGSRQDLANAKLESQQALENARKQDNQAKFKAQNLYDNYRVEYKAWHDGGRVGPPPVMPKIASDIKTAADALAHKAQQVKKAAAPSWVGNLVPDSAASGIGDFAASHAPALKNWWDQAGPTMQSGILGAGAGGLLGGIAGAAKPDEEGERHPWRGALTGALGGAAIGAGGQQLTNAITGSVDPEIGGFTGVKPLQKQLPDGRGVMHPTTPGTNLLANSQKLQNTVTQTGKAESQAHALYPGLDEFFRKRLMPDADAMAYQAKVVASKPLGTHPKMYTPEPGSMSNLYHAFSSPTDQPE